MMQSRDARTRIGLIAAGAMVAATGGVGAEGAFIYGAAYRDGVYRIDVDSGVVDRLGSYTNAWALAASNDPDVLFVANSNGRLASFDILTGASTSIGGRWSTNSLGLATDGFLYSGTWNSGNLTRIDPLSGDSMVIGATGVSGFAGDVVAAPTGDLFGLTRDNEIVLIDTAVGTATVLFSLAGVDGWGIATTYDGRYWLSAASSLYELNMATGELRFALDMGFEAYDLASTPGATFAGGVTIPSPSGSLALLGAGLVVLGVRRRD